MKKNTIFICSLFTLCFAFTAFNFEFVYAAANYSTASYYYTRRAVIKDDNSLWVWDTFGTTALLGNGTNGSSDTPLKVMEDVAMVSTGNSYTMALKSDGSLWGWGRNYYGQIGDGTGGMLNDIRLEKVKVMEDVIFVNADYQDTCAIKKDGSLWGWGENLGGQLNNGNREPSYEPVKIMDDTIYATQITGSIYVIKSDNTLWKIGDRDETADPSPVKLMDGVVQVDPLINISYEGYIALKTDGSVWVEMKSPDPSPPKKVMEDARYVNTEKGMFFVIKNDDSLWAWDYIESPKSIFVPRKINDNVASLGSGSKPIPIVKNDGSLWEQNFEYVSFQTSDLKELNTMNEEEQSSFLKQELSDISEVMSGVKVMAEAVGSPLVNKEADLSSFEAVINGDAVTFHSYNIDGNDYIRIRDLAYALKETNAKFNVEYDDASQSLHITKRIAYNPVGGEMSALASGKKTAILTSAKIFVDGENISLKAYDIEGNIYFKLQDIADALFFYDYWDEENNKVVIDTLEDYDMTALVNNNISYKYERKAVIKDDDSLWMWGSGPALLGDGTDSSESSKAVKVMDDVKMVANGIGYTMALKADNTLWGWGTNVRWQIGDKTVEVFDSITKILDDVAFVSTGKINTFAIKTDGSLWRWGGNDNDILSPVGSRNFEPSDNPVKITDDVIYVTHENDNVYFIKRDYSLWKIQKLSHGRISNTFIKIMDDVAQVAVRGSGEIIIAALKLDGSLWLIPDDSKYLNGTKFLDDVKKISAGRQEFLAIKNDGSLLSFGHNESKKITNPPLKISDNVSEASSGENSTAIIKNDGSLWEIEHILLHEQFSDEDIASISLEDTTSLQADIDALKEKYSDLDPLRNNEFEYGELIEVMSGAKV